MAPTIASPAAGDYLESLMDSNPYVWDPHTTYQSLSTPSSTPVGDLLLSRYTLTTTCLRSLKDADGYEMICFCTGCQDLFLAEESQNDTADSRDFATAGNTIQYHDSTASIAVPTTTLSPANLAPAASRSLKKQQKAINFAGITKTTSQPVRPEALLDQLEVALQGDETTSADFKWKSSILFNELKRLIENESASQQLAIVNRDISKQPPLFSAPRPEKKANKQIAKKSSPLEKPFHCTSPTCKFSTSSAKDWRRHEETHWPQKRYLCIQCPLSTDQTKCSFCTSPLPPTANIEQHYLHCSSAQSHGRTFARKDKLSEHLQKDHSSPQNSASTKSSTWSFKIDSGWPKRCNFCDALFDSWDDRVDHLIEKHFRRSADHRLWQRSDPPVERCLYTSPWAGVTDTCNFDSEFTQECPSDNFIGDTFDNKLFDDMKLQFAGFSYNCPVAAGQTQIALPSEEREITRASVGIKTEKHHISKADEMKTKREKTLELTRRIRDVDMDEEDREKQREEKKTNQGGVEEEGLSDALADLFLDEGAGRSTKIPLGG